MFISKKKHNQIIEHKDKTINDYLTKINYLEKELDRAQDLKTILEKLYPLYTVKGLGLNFTGSSSAELILPDHIPVYVEDILGGKVIKQEATKVIRITKDGEVKTGLTKQKADKNYFYKLIRD